MTEISEIQQLRNEVLLLQRQFDGGQREDLSYYFNTLREEQNKWIADKRTYIDAFNRLKALETRFNEIEKFMKHLLDYFNPNEKMKEKITKLELIIKERDEEIAKTRDILKKALK